MRRSKADLVGGWLEKARRDLTIAKKELDSKEPFTDIVCFHAQQAAEKYLKAYLLWEGIEFPRTHTLEDLVLLAGQKYPAFSGLKDSVAALTPYAVEARYPEFEEPRLEDARGAVKIAKEVRGFVLERLPEEAGGG